MVSQVEGDGDQLQGLVGAAPRTIVSAADAAYFRSLAQLLASLARHAGPAPCACIVYDLGLAPPQRARLAARFPWATVRPFDFSPYPEFVRLRPRSINSNAWKPQVIEAVVAEAAGPVLWLDSATVVVGSLDPIFAWIERTGLYVPFGGTASIAELTHSAALAALGAPPAATRARQRASGVVGIDPRHPRARALAAAWARACLDARCVAPPGATLDNHRFDQSVLNVLLARARDLELTPDELDISSSRPTPMLRARNKVPAAVPLWLDPAVRAWFAAYRAVDVALWRVRKGFAASLS
jgi:hypothetical protein